MSKKEIYPEFWYSKNNEKVSCKEKIIVLNQNLDEIQNLAGQIIDEAILMGVKKEQIESVLKNIIDNIKTNVENEK